MGDRSNINFISDKKFVGDVPVYTVLNVYLHYAGIEALYEALDIAKINKSRNDDASYFANRIVRKVTEGTDDGFGAGLFPDVVDNVRDAYEYESDSDGYPVLTFDLVNQKIVLFDTFANEIVGEFDLNDDNASDEAKRLLTRLSR